jgi:glutamate dehydrogenase/leucine dehydrogenase
MIRLGHASVNNELGEVWQEGEAFRELERKLQSILEEKDQLEKRKKSLQTTKIKFFSTSHNLGCRL